MTIAEYLNLVLRSQKLSDDQEVKLMDNRDQVEALLRDKFADTPLIKFAGSKAKGTMIRENYDVDIVSYFPEECDVSLKDLYDDVCDKLSVQYTVEKKTSALRIKIPSDDGIIDSHIDVVPGKFSDSENKDAFLYLGTGEKERLKTNIKIHIEHIVKSGLRKEIKLAKLWNIRNNLKIKTFVLELLVVEILKNSNKTDIGERMVQFWQKLKDHIDDIVIEDPANPTGNDLSDIFNKQIRDTLNLNAGNTLEIINSQGWEAVFDTVSILQEQIELNKGKTLLEDFSHRKSLGSKGIKLNLNNNYWAKISAGLYFGLSTYRIVNRRFQRVFLKDTFLPKFHWLKYQVDTNVDYPYDIYWQVVNTGDEASAAEAEGKNGLRGKIFEGKRERWERSEYKGKHWIEAFIVVNGECVAKSGPFFVVF